MGQILDAAIAFFQADNWPFEQIAESSVLHTSFQGRNAQWECFARTQESPQRFLFYSLCPVSVSEEKRQLISEFLNRANYGLAIGNFEFDFDDGEVRYKTSVDIEGSDLTFSLIKRLVYANVVTVDQYLPGIRAVIDDDISPAAAISQIERQIVNS
jgi:hypothetical protein